MFVEESLPEPLITVSLSTQWYLHLAETRFQLRWNEAEVKPLCAVNPSETQSLVVLNGCMFLVPMSFYVGQERHNQMPQS